MKKKTIKWLCVIILLMVTVTILNMSGVLPGDVSRFVKLFFPQKFSRLHLIFEETFEPGPKSFVKRGFKFSGNNTVDIVTSDITGTSAAHFSLNHLENDISYRTELVPNSMSILYMKKGLHARYGQAYWYGFRVFIPEDWQWDDDSYNSMVQWHGQADRELGEDHRYPNLQLIIGMCPNGPGRNYCIRIAADYRRVQPPKGAENRYIVRECHEISSATGDVGRWTDWIVKINFSYENDGYFTIWKNGRVVFEYSGPTAFNDDTGPYFKFGIYKPKWKSKKWIFKHNRGLVERHIYFDDIRIGTQKATYRDVAPNPNLDSSEKIGMW